VGDSVKWVQTTDVFHTVTSTASNADAGSQQPDGRFDEDMPADSRKEFTVTFNGLGTFAYYCRPHASWMYGTITVESATTVTATTTETVTVTTGPVGGDATGEEDTSAAGAAAVVLLLAAAVARRRA
jgi:uncharacterized protein (TIGR03382 family)